jgi:serine protease
VSTDQFIVKFKEAAGISSADRQEIYARAEAEVGVPANGLRLAAKGAQIVGTGRALDPVEAKDFLANLRANPDVEYAEPDALMYPMIADPNDPFLFPAMGHVGGTRRDADARGVVPQQGRRRRRRGC